MTYTTPAVTNSSLTAEKMLKGGMCMGGPFREARGVVAGVDQGLQFVTPDNLDGFARTGNDRGAHPVLHTARSALGRAGAVEDLAHFERKVLDAVGLAHEGRGAGGHPGRLALDRRVAARDDH